MHNYITPEQYEQAAQNGISKTTLEQRVRSYNWPIEKAIQHPLRSSNKHWLQIAETHGINPKVFYSRISCGWTHEQAATTPKLSKSEVGRRGGTAPRKWTPCR